jgi:hypothetical protein
MKKGCNRSNCQSANKNYNNSNLYPLSRLFSLFLDLTPRSYVLSVDQQMYSVTVHNGTFSQAFFCRTWMQVPPVCDGLK